MKKLLILAALAAMALNASLWGASITVTSPTSGNEWCIGSSYTITWTSSDVTGNVDIILRTTDSGAAPVMGIAANTTNDGTEGWLIPASVAPGTYLVRIRSVSDPTVYDDSANFTIKNCSAAGITVTKPTGTSSWCKKKTYTITWTSSGVTGNVDIILRTTDSSAPPVQGIAANTANDLTESWYVPETLDTGTYLIRIRSVSDNTIYDDSPAFHIGTCIDHIPDLKKYLEVRWPIGPDPCRCPEWSIKEILERIRDVDPRFVGSLGLLKNGIKFLDLGALGRGKTLPDSVKPTLSLKNFNAFKNGTAKFTMGVFDANGQLLEEIELQGGAQQLR